MKVILQVTAVCLLIGSGALLIWQHRTLAQLRAENDSLKTELTAAREATLSSATAQHTDDSPATNTTQSDRSELLRLRNEVSQLRGVAREMDVARSQQARLQTENDSLRAARAAAEQAAAAAPKNRLAKESLEFAGYASPEAAVQSAFWAMSQGNPRQFLESLTGEERARFEKRWAGKSEEELVAESRRETEKATAVRILERKEVSENEVVLILYAEGEGRARPMTMQRVGNEWRLAGPGGNKK